MIIYEKVVNGERHLFGNYSGNVPTSNDPQLVYKDHDGDVITPVANDTYSDNSKNGKQGIKRASDGKDVNVFIGDHCVIGEVVAKVVKSIRIKTAPTRVNYNVGDALDLAGLVVEATYSDGDKADVIGYTTSPEAGAFLQASDTKVTVTYQDKTAQFDIVVVPPVVKSSKKSTDKVEE